jgi:hypothetical protein
VPESLSEPRSERGQRRAVAGWRSRLVYAAALLVILAIDLALVADGERAGGFGLAGAAVLLLAASVARAEHRRPWRGVFLLTALLAGALPGVVVAVR